MDKPPINERTGQPYFTMPSNCWGGNWSPGPKIDLKINLNKMFLRNPKAFRDVVLTEFQIEILKAIIELKITTASKLNHAIGFPMCTCSSLMKMLCEKGYLSRVLKPGNKEKRRGEYIYTVENGINNE